MNMAEGLNARSEFESQKAADSGLDPPRPSSEHWLKVLVDIHGCGFHIEFTQT